MQNIFRVARVGQNAVGNKRNVTGQRALGNGFLLASSGVLAGGLFAAYHCYGTKGGASGNVALDPSVFKRFKLESVSPLNHNTSLFRFALENPEQELGLNVSSCLVVKLDGAVDKEGKQVIRPYTPINGDERGHMNLLVKRYENGLLTPSIFKMSPGDEIEVKGPIIKRPYVANEKDQIGMISGGTGITPMLQVIEKILDNPNDKTQVKLIFANIAEEDILLKKCLDDWTSKFGHKFSVRYVLERPPPNWNGGIGYINKELLQKFLPPPSDNHLIMVCGPPPMMNAISGSKASPSSQGELSGLLKDIGYTSSQVFKF